MKNTLLAVILIFSAQSKANDLSPSELRDLLVDSIIVDMQTLIDMPESNKEAIILTNKLSALIKSYEKTINAQIAVMYKLKDQLDENNIKIKID